MLSDDQMTESIEVERYELREPPSYGFDANRREFVQVLSAGLMISVSARVSIAQRRGSRRNRPAKLSERFHIGADGVVTVLTGKVEVGQGSRTQIAQATAEELHLPVERIRVIMADTDLCPNDGGTAGSRTTPSTVPQVRRAAAAVRDLLLELAAEQLSVERSALQMTDGNFIDTTSSSQLTLVELAKLDQLPTNLGRAPSQDVSIISVDEWTTLGKPIPKVNGEDVVTGAAKYPSDIVRPGMLYGKVLRPVSFGATLKSIDLTPAKTMDDVTAVQDGNFIGCAAKNSWRAARAIDAIAATADWDRPSHPSSDVLFEHLKETARTSGSGRSRPRVDTWGDRDAGLAAASSKVEATYTIAYIQHAPMEPRAAVAEWNDGKLTVWTGTQQPMRVRSELMSVFRIPEDRVRVIVPDTGGGFGGKHTGDAAVEAARLAKAAGKPVSLRWTRQEEFNWAYCRPAGVVEVTGGLDDAGNVVVWDFTNYNSGGSAIGTPYRVPHGRTRFLACDSPLRQGSYRALASTANTFARESMMDDLAQAAKVDPLEFRLKHLPMGRLRDVLLDTAQKFNWQERRTQSENGHGVGLACGTEKGSYVAACAEVEVVQGRIKVLTICQAYECGAIQNPANLKAQVEGCVIMGLGGALYEEMRFENGVVTSDRFSEYEVPRMWHVPKLDIVLRDRRDLPSVGAGETPIIAVAPAVANAIFQASGVRIFSMPLRTQNLAAV
jgi:isoquinoline 1-oxidoreductase